MMVDQFYGKVSFGNIGLYMGKTENNGYFGNYCNLRPVSRQKQTPNEGMRLIKVKVISWPEPKVIEISTLNTCFSQLL